MEAPSLMEASSCECSQGKWGAHTHTSYRSNFSMMELLEISGGVAYTAFVLNEILNESSSRTTTRSRSRLSQTAPRSDQPGDDDGEEGGSIDNCAGIDCDTLREGLIEVCNKMAPLKREFERTGNWELAPQLERLARQLARIVGAYLECCLNI